MSTLPVSVDYRTVDGTARAGANYLAAQGTLTFLLGQTSAIIPIRIPASAVPAPQKSFLVELTNVSGASMLASRATVTIVSDDPPPFRTPVAYTYDSADGIPLRATFYAPAAGGGPWPLIVWIPGDAAYDAKAGAITALRETTRGFAVVSVTYRPAMTAPFPAQIDDLGAAVRWLRANAAMLGVDPKRFVAWGTGAGGHLVALLGTCGDVQAVVDWGGIADLPPLQADALGCSTIDWNTPASPASLLIGCPVAQCSDAAAAASPARQAGKGGPPVLLMHGSGDCFVSPLQSRTCTARSEAPASTPRCARSRASATPMRSGRRLPRLPKWRASSTACSKRRRARGRRGIEVRGC